MKCPKCNYIAFDSATRCRNCGFEFSLSAAPDARADLPLRSAEPAQALADFDLGAAKRPAREALPPAREPEHDDPTLDPGVPAAPSSDLPLFLDDAPLVRPSAPSAPLSVRRSTPVPSRMRPLAPPRPTEPAAEPALPLGSPFSSFTRRTTGAAASAAGVGHAAQIGVRVGAAVLDWVLLLSLDLVVVYFTIRVSRLTMGDLRLLPAAPLLAFLLLLNGGYLFLFTAAGGQTLGKMAFHLRVVSERDQPLTIGRSLLRVAGFFLGALPAGLGLAAAAFDRHHRGVHDRLAATRVVDAPMS